MADLDMRAWALKGAEQRLLEITEEARTIFATFPELRDQGSGFVSGAPGGSSAGRNEGKQSTAPRRRKRTMSAEARKRIGDAQRKRWAELKASHVRAARADEAIVAKRVRARKKK